MSLRLFIHESSRQLRAGVGSSQQASIPDLFQGDQVDFEFVFFDDDGVVDRTADTVEVGVGLVGQRPAYGAFALSCDGEDTALLDHAATAAQIQSALNGLTGISGDGGVDVSGDDGGPWRVAWRAAGARSSISGSPENLGPRSAIAVYRAQEGDSTTREVQVICLEQQPVAYQDTLAGVTDGSISVSTVVTGGGGANEVQEIRFPATAVGGSWALGITASGVYGQTELIAFDADATTVRSALEDLAGITPGAVTVSKDGRVLTIGYLGNLANTDIPTPNVIDRLVHGKALAGTLDFNTAAVAELVAGVTSKMALFEVKVTVSGETRRVLQAPCRIVNDMISQAALVPLPLPEYYTKAEIDALFPRYVTVPTAKDDWSMFDDVKPTSGRYLASDGNFLYIVNGGVTGWDYWSRVALAQNWISGT